MPECTEKMFLKLSFERVPEVRAVLQRLDGIKAVPRRGWMLTAEARAARAGQVHEVIRLGSP